MRFKIYLPLIRWKWAYDGHLWRRSSNEGNTFAKGMWRVVRKRSIDQMIARSFDQGKKSDGQNKTMWPKGIGHSNAIRAAVQPCWRWCDIQQSPELLWTKRGRLTEPLQITVIWLSKSVIGGRRIFLTKMHTTDGKGICRSSWRKSMRCPRRLRVPSLNKIAQTAVRPSPLWEFRAANCFRDLIATLQNENPRRTAVV